MKKKEILKRIKKVSSELGKIKEELASVYLELDEVKESDELSQELVDKLAKKSGVSVAKLNGEMRPEVIEAMLEKIREHEGN